ncbi:hypothetical protein [Amycolatopsis sp. NPDC102389]|uniref:hypothetical protein n=1 Tax=Amycolatopsis sp. NPDC102389 TaxID=3363941 RepID=UPI00382DC603
MGIRAWIVLGLGAGVIAKSLSGDRAKHGLVDLAIWATSIPVIHHVGGGFLESKPRRRVCR